MTDPAQVWTSFSHDPRRPEYAALRAADKDRNVVHQLLADAYPDGRLDRQERTQPEQRHKKDEQE